MLTLSSSRFAGRCVASLAPARCPEAETLSIVRRPDGAVVVAGRLGAAQAPAIQQFLDRVEGVVKLDCTALKYISSAGLGVLLKTQKRLMAAAGRLQLVGLNEHLRDVFRYSGIDRIFEILTA
jgi:anti-anti-sigma factor